MAQSENGLQIDGSTPERVLIIAAHPDDIEFGVAGSVARWRAAGAEITYCVITDGSAGSNEPGVDIDALARTREVEQRAAAAALGVTDVRLLGYRDGTLEPTLDLRRALTRIIRELRPDRVVTQDPTVVFVEDGYVNHPDHRAAGEAAVYAVFPSAVTRPIFPELLDEGYEPHQVRELYLMLTLNPTHAVDISGVMDRKLEALMHHASQLNEEAGDWIREMNGDMGALAGVEYAELYRVMHLGEQPHEAIEEAAEEAIAGED
jgi:LmbE family N-acetylglucosaminyl deacetylase